MEIRSLGIDEIKADFEAYAYRDDLDGETVKRYQQIIDDLPPVDVFNTDEGLILVGGYHRLEAHRQEGRETITATIHQGTVVEAKMFACKANAQHGLNMTASERKRSRRDFIKFNLERDPLMSNYDIARSYGGCNASTIQRDRKALEADGEIEAATQRKGADGRIINTSSIGEPTSANALVNQTGILSLSSADEVEVTSPSMPIANGDDVIALATARGDVTILDGQVVTNIAETEQVIKKIKHIGAEWAKLESKILRMNIHADTFCQRFSTNDIVDHLIDQDRDKAEFIRTRLVPALNNTRQIITELEERLKTYGQESFDLATADLLDTDKPGQLLMDGLLEKRVVQDGEAESR